MDFDDDILFSTPDMDVSELFPLYDQLKTADGVYQSSYQAVLAYSCAVKANDFSDRYREYAGVAAPDETVHLPMDIQFIEDREISTFYQRIGAARRRIYRTGRENDRRCQNAGKQKRRAGRGV